VNVIEREIGARQEWLDWRKENVNASEAACLFGDGVHPYLTRYELWQLRSGLRPYKPDNPTLRRGRLFEPVALELLSEERPSWQVWRPHVYLHDPEARIGASPDAYAERNEPQPVKGKHRTKGNVQLKTVGHFAFKRDWQVEDDEEQTIVETPLWIAVQSSIEAYLAQTDWAAVAAMAIGDGGVDFYVNEISIKQPMVDQFKALVADFWTMVEEKVPPPVDYERDLDAVFDLYKDADGDIVDLTGDTAFRQQLAERKMLSTIEKSGRVAHDQRREIDAKIIQRLGNAAGARVGSTLLTAKVVKRSGYSVAPTEYRQIRVKGGPKVGSR
jgi:predicted phage-related endonuclease